MTRGINEIDVHTAADELVAKGERPTVDRIRAHLGTGSPNTVTRWLETWWKNLGIRLQSKQPDLKGAPAVLAELAGQWWTLALKHARELELQALSDARQQLAKEYDELRAERQVFADEASDLHAKTDAALQSERLATAQVTELHRFIDQLQAQISELSQQRTATLERLDLSESSRQVLDVRLHELQELARSERESLIEHARSVEDRALIDIDRARQETKELSAKLSISAKQHAAAQAEAQTMVQQAQATAIAATKDADIQRARSELLEDQLAKLQHTRSAINAASQRNQSVSEQRKNNVRRSTKR